MATRRLRPDDWAAAPQTRIQIRATTSREPRDERTKFPKGAQKLSRRAPINYPPGESPPIPNGLDTLDHDSPTALEVVDFAAPDTWPRRGPPPHIVYQQQWGAKRAGSPRSVSQYSSRQSEMSFGILDYYTRDLSPTRSPTLPPTPNLPQIAQAPPKIGTPVIDPAMEKFDFGLPLRASRPSSQPCKKKDMPGPTSIAPDATSGAQRQDRDSANLTPPIPPPKTDKVEPAQTMYSLFPKNTTPPFRHLLTLASRQDASETQETAPSSNVSSIPSHPQPDPSYRPRKESLTSSLRSRKDNFTGYRVNAQRIPLRILSASSTSNTNSSIYTTPRASNVNPASATRTTRTSSSTASAPDSANSSNARSQSRWSEDTISSPVVALQGPRASFGSLLRGVDDERQSGQYPDCFFEDDDDEVVPLTRKLRWGRSMSLHSQQQARKGAVGSGEWEVQRMAVRRSGGWKRWLLCGCGG